MKLNIDTLNKYKEDKLIHCQKHPSLPLLIWNYTPRVQYERLWDEITLKCRALTTDEDGNVVGKSFDKFFNIEEEKCLPNEPFKVYEKLDGSLIVFFWYAGELVVSSRGSFTSDLAAAAKRILVQYDPSSFDPSMVYSGELLAPWNRIVCDYGASERVVLLAKFDKDGKEHPIDCYTNIETVKRYDISELDTIKEKILNNQEGYVVRFESGKRVKVKGDEYVRLHKIVTEVSERNIFEAISVGDNLDSILASVPDELYNWIRSVEGKLRNKYQEILNQCESSYKEFSNRKETAEYFNKQKYPYILFAMFDRKPIEPIIWEVIEKNFLGRESFFKRDKNEDQR